MINLVIDIGNSRTKIALFNQCDLMFSVPLDRFTTDHIQLLKDEHPQLKKAILSTVRPKDAEMTQFLNRNFELFMELDHRTQVPITNLYETPETLGKDRLAAAIGANELFPNQNLLIIDAGTAITYDIVTAQNEFLGGNISPGLEMRFKALHHFTGKLPLVKSSTNFQRIGKNTNDAILAGVQSGILYEVEQNIDYFSQKFTDLQVVMTGGDANFFDTNLKYPIFVHVNLTLIGLNRILEHNAKNN